MRAQILVCILVLCACASVRAQGVQQARKPDPIVYNDLMDADQTKPEFSQNPDEIRLWPENSIPGSIPAANKTAEGRVGTLVTWGYPCGLCMGATAEDPEGMKVDGTASCNRAMPGGLIQQAPLQRPAATRYVDYNGDGVFTRCDSIDLHELYPDPDEVFYSAATGGSVMTRESLLAGVPPEAYDCALQEAGVCVVGSLTVPIRITVPQIRTGIYRDMGNNMPREKIAYPAHISDRFVPRAEANPHFVNDVLPFVTPYEVPSDEALPGTLRFTGKVVAQLPERKRCDVAVVIKQIDRSFQTSYVNTFQGLFTSPNTHSILTTTEFEIDAPPVGRSREYAMFVAIRKGANDDSPMSIYATSPLDLTKCDKKLLSNHTLDPHEECYPQPADITQRKFVDGKFTERNGVTKFRLTNAPVVLGTFKRDVDHTKQGRALLGTSIAEVGVIAISLLVYFINEFCSLKPVAMGNRF